MHMSGGLAMQVMTNMSTLDQVLLAALLIEGHFGGKPECEFAAVAARASTFWKTRPFPCPPGMSQTRGAATQTPGFLHPPSTNSSAQAAAGDAPSVLQSCAIPETNWLAVHAEGLPAAAIFHGIQRLEACNLILVGSRAARWQSIVALNVATDDAAHVLKNSPKIAWVRDVLSAVA
jgi:hypothetical protein